MLSGLAAKQRLPHPDAPRRIMFCDFDETYYVRTPEATQAEDVARLERFIREQSALGGLLVGWVTGSNLESVARKLQGGTYSQLPHFIAYSLGTEIVYTSAQRFGDVDAAWQARLQDPESFMREAEDAARALAVEHGIVLAGQGAATRAPYKKSFYYRETSEPDDQAKLALVRRVAAARGMGINISKCNPMTGDPADCYDVDFIPADTGKRAVVLHMLDQCGVPKDRAFAFGDSGNDLEMLGSVEHGYLVENATAEARSRYAKICDDVHVRGIYNKLAEIIGGGADR